MSGVTSARRSNHGHALITACPGVAGAKFNTSPVRRESKIVVKVRSSGEKHYGMYKQVSLSDLKQDALNCSKAVSWNVSCIVWTKQWGEYMGKF